jgi:phosphohistidine phosphatase
MRLYLVRHGEAVVGEEGGQRPLNDKGQQEVRLMAKFLQENHILVNQIYHSGKLRAEQTAAALAAGLVARVNIDVLPGLLPDDSVKPIAVYCNHWIDDIMLVGHLPFMAKLVSELLLDRDEKQLVEFPTAGIICLERIAVFHWCILWFISPPLLTSLKS